MLNEIHSSEENLDFHRDSQELHLAELKPLEQMITNVMNTQLAIFQKQISDEMAYKLNNLLYILQRSDKASKDIDNTLENEIQIKILQSDVQSLQKNNQQLFLEKAELQNEINRYKLNQNYDVTKSEQEIKRLKAEISSMNQKYTQEFLTDKQQETQYKQLQNEIIILKKYINKLKNEKDNLQNQIGQRQIESDPILSKSNLDPTSQKQQQNNQTIKSIMKQPSYSPNKPEMHATSILEQFQQTELKNQPDFYTIKAVQHMSQYPGLFKPSKKIQILISGFNQIYNDGNSFYCAFIYQYMESILTSLGDRKYREFLATIEQVDFILDLEGGQASNSSLLRKQFIDYFKEIRDYQLAERCETLFKSFSKIDSPFYYLSIIFARSWIQQLYLKHSTSQESDESKLFINWKQPIVQVETVLDILAKELELNIIQYDIFNNDIRIESFGQLKGKRLVIIHSDSYHIGIEASNRFNENDISVILGSHLNLAKQSIAIYNKSLINVFESNPEVLLPNCDINNLFMVLGMILLEQTDALKSICKSIQTWRIIKSNFLDQQFDKNSFEDSLFQSLKYPTTQLFLVMITIFIRNYLYQQFQDVKYLDWDHRPENSTAILKQFSQQIQITIQNYRILQKQLELIEYNNKEHAIQKYTILTKGNFNGLIIG